MQSEGRKTRIRFLTCLFPHVLTLKRFPKSGQIGTDGGQKESGGRCQEDGGGGE